MTSPELDKAEPGKRLIEAAHEAVAIAKGEQPAARLHINGHTYVPEAELAASRERERALERERDEAQALADWYHRTGNEAAERIWAVLIREPYREGGENMLGRVVELKASAEAAAAEVKRLRAETIEECARIAERAAANAAACVDRKSASSTGGVATLTGYVFAKTEALGIAKAIRALADANTQGGDNG